MSKLMKKIISQILVALAVAFSISAQENQPVLFDEFGKMPQDELLARISNLAIEVNKTPNSKALVRISGGDKEYFGLSYIIGSLIKSGWKNNIKQPAEKLLIQFCNVREEKIYTRFFIVRENDKVKTCVKTCDENLISPKQTVLFDNVSYIDYFVKSKTAFDSIEETYLPTDSSPIQYSEFALNILKSFLKDSPKSKVYIMAYLQTNFEEGENGEIIVGKPSLLDKKSYAQNMFRAARKEMLKNGFSASQIVALDGGYVNGNERRLELWFVPQGGAIPKPKPDYFPKTLEPSKNRRENEK
jgi:hypothetical protein